MIANTTVTINKTLYQVMILSFFGVLMWVGWGIYQAMIVPTKLPVDAQILEPMPNSFDEKVMEDIAGRIQLSTNVNELMLQNEPKIVISSASANSTVSGTAK
ncbi:MAG: hypothetical protein WCL07_00710 [bacterium]